MSFFRTADTTYMSYVKDYIHNTKVEVSIDFEDIRTTDISPEQRRHLANKMFNDVLGPDQKSHICSGDAELFFQSNGRNYKIIPKSSFLFRAICSVFRFLKIMKGPSKVDYIIVRSIIPSFIYRPSLVVDVSKGPVLDLDSMSTRMRAAKAYSDPFTAISTALFQDYEPFHAWKDVKDHHYRDASKYQLVLDGDRLTAKSIFDNDVTNEMRVATLQSFRDFVYSQFGESCIKRLQTHYEIDLDQMIERGYPLTPEIVYRVNVGTNHIEVQDVQNLIEDLKAGRQLPQRLKRRLDFSGMSQAEIQNLDAKNPEHFAKVTELLQLEPRELDKIFTGRKLHGKISSWYTQGDDTLFKPWVDQQEFVQTCSKIPGRDWKCFYEDLAMILCKKHLHQKNADQTYRVGALIPAPKLDGQPQLYYRVSSWIHNSRGIYSYTLEPACPGTDLPVIKLYRSTSVSQYNLDGASSYKNDFNPVNPPGYEGSHLLEQYEKPFFDARTIPVWVGYQHLASQQLANNQLEAAKESLLNANKAITAEIEAQYKKPTLKQYIRKYDAEFMELIQEARDEGIVGAYRTWYLLHNLRNAVQYKYTEAAIEVRYLKTFLETAAQNPKFTAKAQELLSWWYWETRSPSPEEKAFQDALAGLSTSATDIGGLALWSNVIHDHAKSKHEDIESKQQQNVDFVGHSLGAACAQRFLVAYTAAHGRIPLPGHQIAARVFDDPAINKSDNKTFIEFNNRHGDLLQSLNAGYSVVRRQETGDPVPQSGEVHLGATRNDTQYRQASKWLRFDAALQKASSKASDPQVRDYAEAHGRLFAAAKTQGAWLKSWLKKSVKKLDKTNPERAERLREVARRIPQHDYKTTYFDSRTQWEFDRPSSARTWKYLRNLWNLPFSFTPQSAERLRTWLSAFFRSGFLFAILPKAISQLAMPNPPDDRTHGDWKKHCDSRGVFVVKEPE
jgi:hypothetical protein